jgi:hypothetical protein
MNFSTLLILILPESTAEMGQLQPKLQADGRLASSQPNPDRSLVFKFTVSPEDQESMGANCPRK